jgi:hypothetical protein
MAYFIFTGTGQGNLYRIAENDSDKNGLHFSENNSIVKVVSDSDFLKIKSEKAQVYLDGDNVVIEDGSDDSVYQEASELQDVINKHVAICNQFIENEKNQDSIFLSRVTSYKNMCESFDTSTVTFPLNKTWQAYLTDNSIDFISPLQFCN